MPEQNPENVQRFRVVYCQTEEPPGPRTFRVDRQPESALERIRREYREAAAKSRV